MKILLCTNAFENVTNGPAKFANLILDINKVYPQHEIRILTEDITTPREKVFFIKLSIPILFKPIGQVLRMFQYHNEAMRIRQNEFPFDVLVYNNAFIGLWSAIRFPKTIGMMNDYGNAHATFRNVLIRKSPFKRFVFKQFEQLSAFFLKKIITNSDYMTKQLNAIYNIPLSKTVRLYKAIEKPLQIKTANNMKLPVQILFVKTDYQIGGLIDLFQALTKVDFKYHLAVVGPGEYYFPVLNEWIQKFAINCTLHGQKSPQEVYDMMLESNIFCVPSHKEALGVANIEAMARGLAVVSTHVGGIPEVLNNGSNGWLVPVSNPDALAEALNECVGNEEERKNRIANAITFSAHFSKEQMINRFIEITDSVSNE